MDVDGHGDQIRNDNPYFSDDSSFYGDEDLRSRLEQEAADIDPSHYWSTHHQLLPVIAFQTQSNPSPTTLPSPSTPLYNPYEGQICGRQLSEPVSAFLTRLPPLTTPQTPSCPWIYIANPYSDARPSDEDWAGFAQTGEALLEAHKTAHSPSAGYPKKGPLARAGQKLETRLLAAAQEKRCTSGKWMLFPSPADVDRCWGLVAEGTANRELGSAAKVAPDDDSGRARLICVYTKDFSDRADVKRVAERLKAMGLLRKKGLGLGDEDRGIYYKADAFTHLGITSGNVWGLKASLYSSKELLAGGGGVGMNGPRSRK